MTTVVRRELAGLIDHTLLKPDATREQIAKLCAEAVEAGFKSVCLNPVWVSYASGLVSQTNVLVCTVIGFPLGATTTAAKAAEAGEAIVNGASELDMVIDLGALKSKEYDFVASDIKAVVEMARKAAERKILVKVIIETCYLTEAEKETACRLSMEAGADFVKTSTGFGSEGAKVEDVRLMRRIVDEYGADKGVKASGGIRDYEKALAMIEAGADRIGTSAGPAIIGAIEKEEPQ